MFPRIGTLEQNATTPQPPSCTRLNDLINYCPLESTSWIFLNTIGYLFYRALTICFIFKAYRICFNCNPQRVVNSQCDLLPNKSQRDKPCQG